MEMEFKDPGRRRRFLVVLIGGVLAAGAGLGAFTLASKGGPSTETLKTTVLVAAHDITARTTVSADDLTTRQVPIDEALAQAYDQPTDAVGRVTSIPIYADQQITPNLFATSTADTDFSILQADETVTATSPYWRAVALEVPPERAVGGEIKAGQHVDVVISVDFKIMAPDAQTGQYVQVDTANAQGLMPGKSTKITFQDVEVLKSTPEENMYVLKVDLHQAEQIGHVIEEAPDAFQLVLRPDEDTRTADADYYGTTTDRLVAEYLFPVPQLGDLSQLLGYPLPSGAPVPVAGGPSASPAPSGSPGPGESPAASPEASPAASPAP